MILLTIIADGLTVFTWSELQSLSKLYVLTLFVNEMILFLQ